MLRLLLLTVILLALAFVGIGIKMFLKKGGEFKKQCSMTDPITGKRYGCTCSGQGGKQCKNYQKCHQKEE